MPMPNPPLPGVAVATKTDTVTRVATTAAVTVAATAIALSMGMSAAMFGFAAAGVNTNTSTSGGGGGGGMSGDLNLVAVGDQFVRGNANDDGYVNVNDANFILNWLYNNGGKPVCMDAADVNDNGSVDLADAKYLMDFLFNGTQPAPKAPWPARGIDPTPDSLGCKPDTTPPVILEPVDIVATSTDRVRIAWATSEPATSVAEYATSTAPADQFSVARDLRLVKAHELTITGLTPGTSYRVRLSGADAAGNVGYSPLYTFTTASAQAKLTVTRAPSSPESGLLPGNTSGLTVAVFRFTAKDTSVRVNRLRLTAEGDSRLGAAAFDQFRQVSLYAVHDGSLFLLDSTVATPTPNRTERLTFNLDNKPLIVVPGEIDELIVKVDTASVTRYPQPSRGKPGAGFRLSIADPSDLEAVAAGVGNVPTSQIALESTTSHRMYVYVSVPTITTNDQLGQAGISSGTLSTATAKNLYRFRVKADSAGDIGLYRVSFLLSTSTATATKLVLSDGARTVASTSTPEKILRDGNFGNSEVYALEFTNDGNPPTNRTQTNVEPAVVAAGSSKTFTLSGDVICSVNGQLPCAGSTGSGSIQIHLLGDANFPNRYPDSAVRLSRNLLENSLIWGDFAISGPLGVASTTAKTAEQWTNGFLVASEAGKLPATSTAVTFSH